jgi:hypothetical protein
MTWACRRLGGWVVFASLVPLGLGPIGVRVGTSHCQRRESDRSHSPWHSQDTGVITGLRTGLRSLLYMHVVSAWHGVW